MIGWNLSRTILSGLLSFNEKRLTVNRRAFFVGGLIAVAPELTARRELMARIKGADGS
jgi:hypothetical protein